MKKITLIFIFIILSLQGYSQILFTESFNVILDSTRKVKGSIIPDFKFQNQKKDLLEIENLADISFRIKQSALTIANKIEFSKFGSDIFLSGGYLYFEYRKFIEETRIIPELFA